MKTNKRLCLCHCVLDAICGALPYDDIIQHAERVRRHHCGIFGLENRFDGLSDQSSFMCVCGMKKIRHSISV